MMSLIMIQQKKKNQAMMRNGKDLTLHKLQFMFIVLLALIAMVYYVA